MKNVIKQGGDVNVRDKFKYTPLHYAVQSQDTLNVNTLLLHGADITMETDASQTALHLAAISNTHIILKRLISHAWQMDLIENVINVYDVNGESALVIAIKNDNQNIVKLLLRNKANIYMTDRHYLTPFLHACIIRSFDIMQILYEKHNIVVNDTDANGNSALMNAILKNDEELMKVLLTMSPDLSIVNGEEKDAMALCSLSHQCDNLMEVLKGLRVKETPKLRYDFHIRNFYSI